MVRVLELHVAKNGDDAWSGTLPTANAERSDGPLATLERARDEIRRAKGSAGLPPGGVVVRVHEGTYHLGRTFALSGEDSGTEGSPILYRAAEGERVVLSGGREVSGFVPYEGAILRCDVSGLGLDRLTAERSDPVQPFELFFGGRRMDLARWPNHDPDDPHDGEWSYVYRVPDNPTRNRFVCSGDRVKRWKDISGAQVHIFPNYDWSDQFLGIESIDADSGIITLAGKTSYDIQPGRRFYVRNVFEELDAPGEWYFDRATNTLYFWPPGPIAGGGATVSFLDTIVALDQAEYVTLRGFAFEHCRKEAVVVKGGRKNTVAGCTIRNVGGYGVNLDGGAENGVLGCDICETGSGGVILSGGDRKTLTPAANYVRNCHIHHYSRLRKCYNPAVLISGVGNRIAHNLMHDAPHNAILLRGNDHLIEYNEIHHVVSEVQDAGAFYLGRDWTERGTIIRYNSFHDLYGYGFAEGDEKTGVWTYESPRATWAIYLDDNASGIEVYGNVFFRCALGAVMIGGGKDNVVENNVIVECYPSVHLDARWEAFFYPDSLGGVNDYMKKKLHAVSYDQPPYSTRYPNLATVLEYQRLPKNNRIVRNVACYSRDDIAGFISAAEKPESAQLWHLADYDPASTVLDGNLVWHDGQPVRVGQNPFLKPGKTVSWEEWRQMGYDPNSRIADPRFVDPAHDEYQLRDDSPAYAMGFTRIPMEEIGLYHDEYRASWPVDANRRKGDVQRRRWTFTANDREKNERESR